MLILHCISMYLQKRECDMSQTLFKRNKSIGYIAL